MSLVKFNQRRFPWFGDSLANWFDNSEVFTDDFLNLKTNIPAMNVKENPENFEVELAVPGFEKKDIEVSIENDVLHICAEKKKEEVEDNDEGYTRKEFSYNSFDRRLQLPKTVNQSKEVKANYKNGVLKLQLAKSEAAAQQAKKRIEIA